MVRQPAVAGQFYPGSPDKLRAMIDSLVDRKAKKEAVIGLLSPHAGYIYSGAVAAAVISRIKFKDTFVIIGPNHTGMGGPFSIMTRGVWQTPLGGVDIDSELATQILAASSHLAEDSAAHRYEHSIEVQLPFLQYFKPDVRLVPILLSPAAAGACKEIGGAIARAVVHLARDVVIMASSDMSHYEPQESAVEKDNQAIDAILDLDEDELLRRVTAHNISMCGYGPAISLISAARELGAKKGQLIKYQTSGDVSGDYSRVVGYAGIILTAGEVTSLAGLAREAVEAYVTRGEGIEAGELTPEMGEKSGVFVSIKKAGTLRGCIGTFEPCRDNVAEEIIANAVSSATRDPRFPPVSPDELKELSYSVDVLTRPEPVASEDELDARKYGVIVETGPRRGLLLPDLEGVDSVKEQIAICRSKAGIGADEPVKLYRFEVKRHK